MSRSGARQPAYRLPLIVAALAAAACPLPQVTVTVDAAAAPNGSALFARLYAQSITPDAPEQFGPALPLPACDDIAFGDVSLGAFAAVKRYEGRLEDIAAFSMSFNQDLLLVVEAREEDGVVLAAGCTRATLENKNATIAVALETVATATTDVPVTLARIGASGDVDALRVEDGAPIRLVIDLVRADGVAAPARTRVTVSDLRGAPSLAPTILEPAGPALTSLPIPAEVIGPFHVDVRAAWSAVSLPLDGIAVDVRSVALDRILDIDEAKQVALVGEQQGHAPTIVAVGAVQIGGSTRERIARQDVGSGVPATGDQTQVDAERMHFVGGVARGGAARLVTFHSVPIADGGGNYRVLDDALDELSRVSLAGSPIAPPLAGLVGLSLEGCTDDTSTIVVGTPGAGAGGLLVDENTPVGVGLLLDGGAGSITATNIVSGRFTAAALATMACFGGACFDTAAGPEAFAGCALFASGSVLGQANLVGSVDEIEVAFGQGIVVPGIVAADGTPREAVDGEERLIAAALHNDLVEISSYAIDSATRSVSFRNVEMVVTGLPTVMRRSATLLRDSDRTTLTDGLVVGIVVDDTARIVVLGPSREGATPAAMRALGVVTHDCFGCSTSPLQAVGCAIGDQTGCPPSLLLETGDVDNDGAAEIIVGGVGANGARTFSIVDPN